MKSQILPGLTCLRGRNVRRLKQIISLLRKGSSEEARG